jgi:hypothetical protein
MGRVGVESLARYLTVEFWFPCRPSHPRFRLTTTQPRWKLHQALHQSNLDQLRTSSALRQPHPFRSSKQNLSRKTPQCLLSSRIGRGTYPPQPRHRLCCICQQFAPRFAMLLRHQTATAFLLSGGVILIVQLRH